MSSFVIYDADGVILRTGHCPESMLEIQAQAGEFILEGAANDATQYISNGIVANKHAIAPIVSGLIVSNLPIPCALTIDNTQYQCTDGVAELSFNLPGTYRVRIEALHHIPCEIEVTA